MDQVDDAAAFAASAEFAATLKVTTLTAGDDYARIENDAITVDGLAGNDTLLGLGTGDTLIGGAGDDYIFVGRTGGVADGAEGADTIEAVMTKKVVQDLTGGEGSDTFSLLGAGGNAKVATALIRDFDPLGDRLEIDGQLINPHELPSNMQLGNNAAGYATISIANESGAPDLVVFEVLSSKALLAADAASFGTEGADTIYVDGTAYVANGLEGEDRMYSLNGENTLIGGRDDDYLYAGKRTSELQGGQGDDTLVGSLTKGADHVLSGGSGADLFDLRLGADDDRFEAHITIEDYDADLDRLSIGGRALSDGAAEGWTLEDDADGNAVIGFGGNDSVTLVGWGASDIVTLYDGFEMPAVPVPEEAQEPVAPEEDPDLVGV